MRSLRLALVLSFLALSTGRALAGPCPLIGIVLDRSGSMTAEVMGGGGDRWTVATKAIETLLTQYGKRLPIGLVTFQSGFNGCTDFSAEAVIDPKVDNGADILMKLKALAPDGITNTGEGVDKMTSILTAGLTANPDRPGGYIILITDGAPNCNNNDGTNPTFTVGEITKAAAKGIKTFVVGFGDLTGSDATNMDSMATAGGVPCMGATCAGRKFYVAESAAALNAALDQITQTINGEFGGSCDDSCYANGCPNAGEICVQGKCKQNPCETVTTCAPGDYCFTDGNSPGTCVKSCGAICPTGQVCTTQGSCQADPCAAMTCQAGQTCRNGQCVKDSCTENPCDPGMLCYQGRCIDDPCRYLTCPSSTTCVNGTGACAATLTTGTGSGGGRNRGGSGCDVSAASSASTAPLLGGLVLLALAALLRARRA